MTDRGKAHVFIDESGQRSPSAKSSDYFIMSAVLIKDINIEVARQHLTDLKLATNRRPEQILHWTKLKQHHRSEVSTRLGAYQEMMFISVVTCKRVLARKSMTSTEVDGEVVEYPTFGPLSEDEAYLKTYQYLLERISWMARSHNVNADITIEHTIRFKSKALREFEAKIKASKSCSAAWDYLPDGAKFSAKKDSDLLQLADLVASGIASAFNGHPVSGTKQDHVKAMRPRMWDGPGSPKLTTYGLKMHPWDETTKKLHPWLLGI